MVHGKIAGALWKDNSQYEKGDVLEKMPANCLSSPEPVQQQPGLVAEKTLI